MTRWGITLPLSGIPLSGQRDLVTTLPDLGYTDAWSSEVSGADAFTPLALAAQWTSKQGTGAAAAGSPEAGGLRLGTAVANIYTRGPALLAMSAATLAGLAPGRFVLGIGVSSPTVVTDWNGIALDRPYQRARDTLAFLRRALAGEKVSMDAETFSVSGFRLDPAPVPPPALALAALRPGMVSLAAAMSDGAITNWLAPADVPAVRAVAGPDCELIARIFVCPTADAGLARGIGRRMIAAYLTVPAYAAFHDWLGRGPRFRPMREAWAAGDRKAALAAIDDDLVDELVVHGPPGYCRERVAEYQAAGLDTPVIAIVPAPGVDEAEAVRQLAPA
ncbi:MAG TPA: LLM class F420-dependent oxidoreductase [Streptosporangiaceae bacterium]